MEGDNANDEKRIDIDNIFLTRQLQAPGPTKRTNTSARSNNNNSAGMVQNHLVSHTCTFTTSLCEVIQSERQAS